MKFFAGTTLKIYLAKCSFFCKAIMFFGHKVSHNGIHMDSSKKVLTYIKPSFTLLFQSFLGLCLYYG